MNYKGFVIKPSYFVGSDFTINSHGEVRNRKPTKKDIEYYEILDPMNEMKVFGCEFTITECKKTIKEVLIAMQMTSNSPKEWIKLK